MSILVKPWLLSHVTVVNRLPNVIISLEVDKDFNKEAGST